jgi:exosome complex RNA-binding protein Csl4
MKKTYENMAEAYNELGPTAVDVFTGKSVFTKEFLLSRGHTTRPVNVARRQSAARVLNNIAEKQTVTFPYNGQIFTAKVDKINTTTATVTILEVAGYSNNPRQRPILPGAKGVRVPASILARK